MRTNNLMVIANLLLVEASGNGQEIRFHKTKPRGDAFLLELLRRGPKTPAELTERPGKRLKMSANAVRQQLHRLKSRGLVIPGVLGEYHLTRLGKAIAHTRKSQQKEPARR